MCAGDRDALWVVGGDGLGGLTAAEMVKYRQRDERGGADIAAVWPDDGSGDMLRGGLLYQRYSISDV